MGGPGSGTWYRWNTRTTLDGVKRLDVRWLHRQGYLQPGCSASVTWHQGERHTGDIMVMRQQDDLVLHYRYRAGGGDWQDVRQVIVLDWTSCHYGGQRPWFLCPSCARRVAVLCDYTPRFLCRHCSGLPYGSQRETSQKRRYRKVRKMRQRLGASENLMESISPWDKPKGMHWRTWGRLCQQEEQMELQICQDLDMFCRSLWRSVDKRCGDG